jgi:hypothetical protein
MTTTEATEFIVGTDKLSELVIRDSGNHIFHYFFYKPGSRLIKQFVLEKKTRVTTLCEVTLIKRDGKFTPRLRIWKRDEAAHKQSTSTVGAGEGFSKIKAGVSLEDCHESFWRLIRFLLSFDDFDIPESSFSVVESADASFAHKVLNAFNTDGVRTLLLDAKREDVSDLYAAVKHAKNKQALSELNELIAADATELKFQDWFQRNTWAFGVEYLQIYNTSRIGIHSDSDFIAQSLDGYHDLVELKRPSMDLLKYDDSHRDFYPSVDLAKAIGQAVDYLYAMERSRNDLEEEDEITVLKPRIKIIAGLTAGYSSKKRRALRLINNGLHGMEVISYDQVIARAQKLIDIYSSSS